MSKTRKLVYLFFIILSIFLFLSCDGSSDGGDKKNLSLASWSPDVKKAINDFVDSYGVSSANYDSNSYVVFDFDNTCSIFDIEEQLMYYQLGKMAFAFTPDEISDVLFEGLGDKEKDRSDLGYGKGSYTDWVYDIQKAYKILWDRYGPFKSTGVNHETANKLQNDADWKEFATKMRAMYNLIGEAETTVISYPWVTYWFTGMTSDEVYKLAKESHSKYKGIKTEKITLTSPSSIESRVGVVSVEVTLGINVAENIKELWEVLNNNGIDVNVVSASQVDVVRAAVDVFGLHKDVSTVFAIICKTDENGKYTSEYDYGFVKSFIAEDGDKWRTELNEISIEDESNKKILAIKTVLYPNYENKGPLAGFMDSTGDFNFCTEFNSLKLVTCFNRADRPVTDGGGLISEVAMYQKDTLGYDLLTANKNNDTLYVLQGRNENGYRSLRNSNKTIKYGAQEEKLFKNDDNYTMLQYMIDNKLSTKDAINRFCKKTSEEKSEFGFKYGFLEEYSGYHSK